MPLEPQAINTSKNISQQVFNRISIDYLHRFVRVIEPEHRMGYDR